MSQINLPNPYTFSNISPPSVTLTTPGSSYSVGYGACGGVGSILTTSTVPSYTYATTGYGGTTWTPDMEVTGTMRAKDVEIDGVSMKELLKTIQDRLAILTPDPEKLAKFEALKQCYEQYKILEKLCIIEKDDSKK